MASLRMFNLSGIDALGETRVASLMSNVATIGHFLWWRKWNVAWKGLMVEKMEQRLEYDWLNAVTYGLDFCSTLTGRKQPTGQHARVPMFIK
eukprot:scaffold369971_cov28-Prasinocladus_malaysianus.AAC.1